MSAGDGSGEVYYFLTLFERVAGDDAALRRRINELTPDDRRAVARDVVPFANSMDNDDVGRQIVADAIRRAVRNL